VAGAQANTAGIAFDPPVPEVQTLGIPLARLKVP
jgi:hypothetical protein